MKRVSGLFLVFLVLVTAPVLAAENTVKLQLPWLHQFQFAGYYAALEQGYYAEAGLDVIIMEGKPGLTSITEVCTGRAEYGVGRSAIMAQRMNGYPIIALAAIFQHSAVIFLSKKDAGINSPKDIVGRRVMLMDGLNAAEYMAVLKSEGIQDSEINRISSSYNINDLIEDKTDVFNAYSTNEPFFLNENNIPFNVLRPRDYGVDFYGDVLFTMEQRVKNNPEQVRAFREASINGWHYALDHEEELIDLIIEKYKVQKTREHLRFEADAIRELIMPELIEVGYMNPGRWKKIADTFVRLGLSEGTYSIEGFIFTEGVEAEKPVEVQIFTKEELAYLKNKKVIKMCNNPNWAPIEFAKDGDLSNMQGIAIETLNILEEKMGVEFINVPTSSWNQSQQFLENKKCDILPCAVKTGKREKYANFTKPYLNLPLAIFTTKDKRVVSGLDEIMDKPWTRQKGSGLITKLKQDYPDMNVIETRGDQEALQYVNSGKAYFTIATLPVASHVISKFQLNNLQIAGYSGLVYDLCIAVRDDDEMLLSILDKALADISRDRARQNLRKWVRSSVKEPVPDYKMIFQILAVAFVVLAFFVYRQYILNKNIASLKTAESQVNAEKERLLVTLRSIGDGVITTDLDGRIILINKVSEEITGWKQEEAIGRPIEEVFHVVHERTGEPCENPVEKVLALGHIVELANHTALIAKNGQKYCIEDSAAPIFNEESKIIGIVLVYRDVTEERKTKEELIKARKLESVGVLAGGIAHDFNNILTAILGNIELASDSVETDSEAMVLLKDARKASIRAKDLTQQLLTFAKGGDPVKRASAIPAIVTDSANFVLHGSTVSCDFRIPDDLWKADVDAGQISQVIQNIIINSRQAMPDGGVIIVSCENIADIRKESIYLPDIKYIKIALEDSGSGIPQKYLGQIFDPYFTTKQEGSGLGLAICHSIIHKHDGTITVESVTNVGTTFSIYLPAATEPSIDDGVYEDPLREKAVQATIMVMDDEVMVQNVTKRMLERAGHEVILVADGSEAIAKLKDYKSRNQPIDLILLDLTIPGGMGGKDTVKELLKIDSEARVVVASGYSNDPAMAQYREYGFIASLTKPFQWDELKDLIQTILD